MKHKHHKIVFKDGKRIRTKELIEYTVEEHANEHKRLYKKYGHWKDKLAWQGLSGQIGKETLVKNLLSENGKNNVRYLTKSVRKKAIENARKTNTGRKLSAEHLAKTRTWGMKQSEYQKQRIREIRQKNYLIEDPKGTKYTITNLRKFAINNNLDQGNLTKVAQGKLPSHKGYKVYYR